ncbi:AMP-binding protein [Rossellomorea vietnamensis]|uniref:AMP-binding protein n=1 Tax=Rossellomorea vietnamensis TaxID=218284 RepID=A0A6I6UNL0_9BACI|nr:class I adenylate-forming enzyme family protein [Rossellomorea vietnamensis]QHE59796.1 AMP-binding protein [Rossellomorea vietnamensis]
MEFLHDLISKPIKGPEKIAIKTKYEDISNIDLINRVLNTVLFLKQYNLSKGDRVLILLPNCIETIQLLFALSKMGIITVIVHPKTSKKNLNYIISDCKPKLVVHNSMVENVQGYKTKFISKDSLNEFLRNLDKEKIVDDEYSIINLPCKKDVVLLIYTSGSTGNPKAVIATHKQITFCIIAISESLSITDDDVIGNFLPFSFDYGLYQIFFALYSSATICIGDYEDAGIQLYKYLDKWQVTIFPSMPHLTEGLIKLIKRNKKDLKLRMITNTGERFSEDLIDRMKFFIPECKVVLMYGLTECKRVSILEPSLTDYKRGSVGKPLPGTKCYVVDEENRILKNGEIGELIVTGPNVTDGYWNCNELTNMKFKRVEILDEIALYTGDLFRVDCDGYLYFHGRRDDQYKHKGFRISGIEIEEVVQTLDGVEKAVLIPPDNQINQSFLFIVGDIEINIIKDNLLEKLEDYKMPSRVIKLEKLPITNNGKINKVKLKLYREKYL